MGALNKKETKWERLRHGNSISCMVDHYLLLVPVLGILLLPSFYVFSCASGINREKGSRKNLSACLPLVPLIITIRKDDGPT